MASNATKLLAGSPVLPAAVRTELWVQAGYPEGTVPDFGVDGLRALPVEVAVDVAERLDDDRLASWWHRDRRVKVRAAMVDNKALPDSLATAAAAWQASRGKKVYGRWVTRVGWDDIAAAIDATGASDAILEGGHWEEALTDNLTDAAVRPWCATALGDLVATRLADGHPEGRAGALAFAAAVFDAAPAGSPLRCRAATLVWRTIQELDGDWALRLASDRAAAAAAVSDDSQHGPVTASPAALTTLAAAAPAHPMLGWALRWSSRTHLGDVDPLLRQLTRDLAEEIDRCGGGVVDWHPGIEDHWARWLAALTADDVAALTTICRSARCRTFASSTPPEWAQHLAEGFLDRFEGRVAPAAGAALALAAASKSLAGDLVAGRFGPPSADLLVDAARSDSVDFRSALLTALWGTPELFNVELVAELADRIPLQVWHHGTAKFSAMPAPAAEVIAHRVLRRDCPEELEAAVAADPLAAAFVDAIGSGHPHNVKTAVELLSQVTLPAELRPDVARAANQLSEWASGRYPANPPTPELLDALRKADEGAFRRLAGRFARCAVLPAELRLHLAADVSVDDASRAALLDEVAAGEGILTVLAARNRNYPAARWLAGDLAANQPTRALAGHLLAAAEAARPGDAARLVCDAVETVGCSGSDRPVTPLLAELVATTRGIPVLWAGGTGGRLTDAVCRVVADRFGDHTGSWQLFAELADGFDGTVEELADLVTLSI